MTRPTTDIVQVTYQNPHASMPLCVPVAVVCNTPDEALEANIRHNAARDIPWVALKEAHDGIAVMVGGGPSLGEHLDDVRDLQREGGDVFAMNGASRFVRERGVKVRYQVIADAKEETSELVDHLAGAHLFASQVHPRTIDTWRLFNLHLWHLEIGDIERYFPEPRKKRGGYVLVGGGAAVGNSAMCLAYAMGYRRFEVFGYDSSHKGDESHAYPQPMNAMMPGMHVEWAGRKFWSSLAMKAQAEKFQITGQALQQAGCEITVHGDGLLPHMWRTPATNLTERDTYRALWQFDAYREHAPGEGLVELFLSIVQPDGLIIDFGCGTGRAALRLKEAGHEVMLLDFADNCRDDEALSLPFLEWDLTRSCPLRAPYGLCTDVMEHIAPGDVDTVLDNIMEAAQTVLFQISTVEDAFGDMIGRRLHLTVQGHDWWRRTLSEHGEIAWEADRGNASIFVLSR